MDSYSTSFTGAEIDVRPAGDVSNKFAERDVVVGGVPGLLSGIPGLFSGIPGLVSKIWVLFSGIPGFFRHFPDGFVLHL